MELISPVVEWLALLSREFRRLQAGAVNCRLAGKHRLLQNDVSVVLRNRRHYPYRQYPDIKGTNLNVTQCEAVSYGRRKEYFWEIIALRVRGLQARGITLSSFQRCQWKANIPQGDKPVMTFQDL